MKSFFKSASPNIMPNYNFEILFQKCFTKYNAKKKYSSFFFWAIILKSFFKSVSPIIMPKKKGTIFFCGIIFGEPLLKKDFEIIVPKKRIIFFWALYLLKHF